MVLAKQALVDAYINNYQPSVYFLTYNTFKWTLASVYLERVEKYRHTIGELDWTKMAPIGVAFSFLNGAGCEVPLSTVDVNRESLTGLTTMYAKFMQVERTCVEAGFKPVYRITYCGSDSWTPTAIICPTEEDAVIVAAMFDGKTLNETG